MLNSVFRWLGFGLCHQLPERSFFGGGIQVPVCARDAGIYVGFTVSLALLLWMHRKERPRGFAPWYAWIVFGILLAWMGFDGVSSYAGFRATTNQLRLITGLGVGFAAAALIVPMLNDGLWRVPGTGRVLDPWWRFAAWLVAIPVTWAAIWYGGATLGVGLPFFVAACIVITMSAIALVVVLLLPPFERSAEDPRRLALAMAVALMASIALIVLSAWLRVAVTGTTSALLNAAG